MSRRGLKVGEKGEIKPGLFKRDVTIADENGHMRLTVKLEDGKIYRLQNPVVKSFNT